MFKVMCFGLKNAPSSFSRLMEIVLRQLQNDKCLVYLDDNIVLGENFEAALENLRAVFVRVRQAHLQLKVSKCKLFQREVVFWVIWCRKMVSHVTQIISHRLKLGPGQKTKLKLKVFSDW